MFIDEEKNINYNKLFDKFGTIMCEIVLSKNPTLKY